MTDRLNIPVILGSIRKDRRSARPGQLLVERVEAAGHRSQLIDLRELALPMFDEEDSSEHHPSVAAFRQLMADSDAAVWLSPEYNHSFTSAIKNAIDYLHGEIRRKPAAVCGLSAGVIGGARAIEQLQLVLIELHAVPIRDSVYFSDARHHYDENGTLLHPEFIPQIDQVIGELAWYAQALKWGRENVPLPSRKQA